MNTIDNLAINSIRILSADAIQKQIPAIRDFPSQCADGL